MLDTVILLTLCWMTDWNIPVLSKLLFKWFLYLLYSTILDLSQYLLGAVLSLSGIISPLSLFDVIVVASSLSHRREDLAPALKNPLLPWYLSLLPSLSLSLSLQQRRHSHLFIAGERCCELAYIYATGFRLGPTLAWTFEILRWWCWW